MIKKNVEIQYFASFGNYFFFGSMGGATMRFRLRRLTINAVTMIKKITASKIIMKRFLPESCFWRTCEYWLNKVFFWLATIPAFSSARQF